MYRNIFLSRLQIWFLAGLLCLFLTTAVLVSNSHPTGSSIADWATPTPTATPASGWTDPIGG